MEAKKIGTIRTGVKRDEAKGVVEVMKPFVSFGVKALGVLGSTLIHIVKNIPKPASKAEHSKDKVIKI